MIILELDKLDTDGYRDPGTWSYATSEKRRKRRKKKEEKKKKKKIEAELNRRRKRRRRKECETVRVLSTRQKQITVVPLLFAEH